MIELYSIGKEAACLNSSFILSFFMRGRFTALMLLVHLLAVALLIHVIVRCFVSLRRGRRIQEAVIYLSKEPGDEKIPVLYWENSIGREKTCDILLSEPGVSRDHAVLKRREGGWIIADTNSRAGTFVNEQKIETQTPIRPGDRIRIGEAQLVLTARDEPSQTAPQRKVYRGGRTIFTLLETTAVFFLLTLEACFQNQSFRLSPFLPFLLLSTLVWGVYLYSIVLLKRINFEIETVGLLLTGIGVLLLFGVDPQTAYVQLAAAALGILLFCAILWILEKPDFVSKLRIGFEVLGVALFAATFVFGTVVNGAKNWIFLGSLSIQPSELVKIIFIFAGASTLDRLQTHGNLIEFIAFAAVCTGFLFLMHDFGSAVIFFFTFLLIAFMRSGSVRTVVLAVAAAALGVFLILQFKPYVAQRFAGWGHVWEYPYDSLGYQQTRTLTYIASGGLFGSGLGNGYLKNIFAGDSDLVFGVLCEELGLVFALAVCSVFDLLALYTLSDVTRSRSTIYSISSCAAAGLLLFQAMVNIFGVTDLLPLTGVTLPFISAGGSSMVCVWGLIAFIKASDERTYGARRRRDL